MLGAEAVVEAVAGLAAGSLLPVPQPVDGATYAAKIRKEEALIDWASAAPAIARQVRAFNPWPVAETRWQGRQLRIWEARPLVEVPGEPASRNRGWAACAGPGDRGRTGPAGGLGRMTDFSRSSACSSPAAMPCPPRSS